MKALMIRLGIVAIVAVFPAMLIGMLLPALLTVGDLVSTVSMPSVIDLSGPQTIRTCPAGMKLRSWMRTRPNYNMTGTITNVGYECVGANGATTRPRETFKPVANGFGGFNGNSPTARTASWLRWWSYPIAFALTLAASFFLRIRR